MRSLALVTVLAALVCSGCADARDVTHASPTPMHSWSKAVKISRKGEIGVNWMASLAYTNDGHAITTLDGRYEGQLTSVLAADPGSNDFRKVGEGLLLAPPAAYGSNGVAFLRVPTPKPSGKADDAIDYGPVTDVGVSLGSVPGALGDLQPLARIAVPPREVRAAISGSPRGDIAAAWVQPAGKRRLLQVVIAPAGQGFGAPRTLADERDLSGVALAYGAGGDLLIAFDRGWDATQDVAARVLRPGGDFGPIQSLGRSRGSSSLAVAVSPAGDAVVAWGTQHASYDLSEADSAWSVRAALLARGSQRFAAPRLLDPGHDVDVRIGGVYAALAPDATATVAWTGMGVKGLRPLKYVGRCYPCPVRAATSRPGGRFGPAEQLAGNGVALGVVSARDATTTVLWGLFAKPEQVDDYVESLDRMYASRRAPGGRRFVRPRPLSPREPIVKGGSLALDPVNQRPSALWIESVGGSLDVGLYDFPPVDALFSRGPP